ncbi:cytosolic sulfotransferase 15-like [Vigna umbellata]|uniref:cytosolic sulfotransferase 15-like n=1 Tax=Vigna umbellata TaxID=87088 RepID=UPI001F5F592A|nr:cytosolic sulfotransferase 15-like [Vigna umbellata]
MISIASKEENAKEKSNLSLYTDKTWPSHYHLQLFQNFWCPSIHVEALENFQKHFQAKESDVIVASFPKSGTIWLKALTFAIVNHQRFSSLENHPLLTSNPHELVPFLESVFGGNIQDHQIQLLDSKPDPRIFGTHTPFPSLPESIKESNCKIIYICRNPYDNFVSAWVYFNKIKPESLPAIPMDEAFELYCKGILDYGPWWSHMLGYWKESIAKPNKVLFVKYDDLTEDANFHVKRIADFFGCSFTEEEENNGIVENIIQLCSFKKMKDLEVNKSGKVGIAAVDKKNFFRKGETGDWVNHFSPSMIEKLSKIVEEKLQGSGLSFKNCP